MTTRLCQWCGRPYGSSRRLARAKPVIGTMGHARCVIDLAEPVVDIDVIRMERDMTTTCQYCGEPPTAGQDVTLTLEWEALGHAECMMSGEHAVTLPAGLYIFESKYTDDSRCAWCQGAINLHDLVVGTKVLETMWWIVHARCWHSPDNAAVQDHLVQFTAGVPNLVAAAQAQAQLRRERQQEEREQRRVALRAALVESGLPYVRKNDPNWGPGPVHLVKPSDPERTRCGRRVGESPHWEAVAALGADDSICGSCNRSRGRATSDGEGFAPSAVLE